MLILSSISCEGIVPFKGVLFEVDSDENSPEANYFLSRPFI